MDLYLHCLIRLYRKNSRFKNDNEHGNLELNVADFVLKGPHLPQNETAMLIMDSLG